MAYGVTQWSNCPIMTTVSGRTPSRRTALPRVSPTTDSMITGSPSSIPRARAAPRFTSTPRCPATLPATSLMRGMPAFAPHEYCMLRAVRAQKGNSPGSRPTSRA